MKLSHKSLQSASESVVQELGRLGGSGGLIAVDDQGNCGSFGFFTFILITENTDTMPLNSAGMFRGVIGEDGVALTAIFDDDVLA